MSFYTERLTTCVSTNTTWPHFFTSFLFYIYCIFMESARSFLVGSNVLIHHMHVVQNMHTVQQWAFIQSQHYTLCKNLIANNEDMWVQSVTFLQYLETVNTVRYGYIAVTDPRYSLLCLVRHEQHRWPGPCYNRYCIIRHAITINSPLTVCT